MFHFQGSIFCTFEKEEDAKTFLEEESLKYGESELSTSTKYVAKVSLDLKVVLELMHATHHRHTALIMGWLLLLDYYYWTIIAAVAWNWPVR